MSVIKAARTARSLTIQLATSGSSQNFLGASWVAPLVDKMPEPVRERAALRILSFSPHYFFNSDTQAEAERNRRSRKALAEALIEPHITPGARVIDYGCGPGYMACAVAEIADHIDAVDISTGVLACARALNGNTRITYLTPEELWHSDGQADLAYSFAVVQHMRTEALIQALHLLAAKVRRGGTLLVHFAEPGQGGWRTQAEWDADRSLVGRLKWRYGMNCFGRTSAEMADLAAGHGFTNITVAPIRMQVPIPDEDVTNQHLLIAQRA
jgi:SAM-dependent methyltransferase